MALLLITHDLNIVRRIADRVYVMRTARSWSRATRALFASPEHPYTALLAAEPTGHKPAPPSRRAGARGDRRRGSTFQSGGGLLARADLPLSAVDGVSRLLCARARPSASSASGLRQVDPRPRPAAPAPERGPDPLRRPRIDGSTRRDAPLRKQMQIVLPGPFGSLSPRLTSARSSPKACSSSRRSAPPSATVAPRRPSRKSGSTRAANRYPHEFSGGQRQRIAMRAPSC